MKKVLRMISSGGVAAVFGLLVLGLCLTHDARADSPTPTQVVNSTQSAPGTTPEPEAGTSSMWLFAALGLGALTFGLSGVAVARKSK